MTLSQFLAAFPGVSEFSRRSLLVLFAYFLRQHKALSQFSSKDLKVCFSEADLKVPTDFAALLKLASTGRGSPLIKVKPNIYALSAHGVLEVEAIQPPVAASDGGNLFIEAVVARLGKVLTKVTNPDRRDFLAEAVSCLGVNARRSTIVMVWLVTIDHMYEYVLTHHLADFNSALAKRIDRLSKLTITTRDDFLEMKESQFIEVCRSAGVISKDIRKLLAEKLDFRNSCAHPAAIAIGDSKVASYIEDLVDNVITRHVI